VVTPLGPICHTQGCTPPFGCGGSSGDVEVLCNDTLGRYVKSLATRIKRTGTAAEMFELGTGERGSLSRSNRGSMWDLAKRARLTQ